MGRWPSFSWCCPFIPQDLYCCLAREATHPSRKRGARELGSASECLLLALAKEHPNDALVALWLAQGRAPPLVSAHMALPLKNGSSSLRPSTLSLSYRKRERGLVVHPLLSSTVDDLFLPYIHHHPPVPYFIHPRGWMETRHPRGGGCCRRCIFPAPFGSACRRPSAQPIHPCEGALLSSMQHPSPRVW